MLESLVTILLEFVAYIVFECIAALLIAPILKGFFLFFRIPIVDKFFNFLAKILAIGLFCLAIYLLYYLFRICGQLIFH